MNATKGFALFFALSAIVIRLIAYYSGYVTASTAQYVIILHLIFILLSIFFALRNNKSTADNERDLLIDDMKAGMKAGSLYAIVTTVFVWVYFKYIDTAYFISKREELINAQLGSGTDPEKIRQNVEGFFSLMNYTTVTLIGLITISMVYTLMLAVLNRFVLRRFS